MGTESMDTITLDDLPNNSNDIIDLDEYNSDVEISGVKKQEELYEEIAREDKQFWELIERCLEVDHSEGMQRVINRSLIPIYKKSTKEFRNSCTFNRLITRAMCKLEKYPFLKFSHVKELCDSLKKALRKESKPNLNNLPMENDKLMSRKGKIRRMKMNKFSIKKVKNKGKDTEIIVSDDSDGFEVPIVNLNGHTDQTYPENNSTKDSNTLCNDLKTADVTIIDTVPVEFIQIDDESNCSVKQGNKQNEHKNKPLVIEEDEEKENNYKSENKEKSDDTVTTICLSDDEITNDNITNSNNPKPLTNELEKLLVPQREESCLDYHMKQQKIKNIESEIERYKILIEKLEEEEVLDDTIVSPYIQCERYKQKLVIAYKQLCELTGERPVKRREVRLKAANARSQLPLRKLEEFINSNIGSDGLPHFPDFGDVVDCVEEANRTGELGWNKQTIMKEARSLFACCGQALQRNRQRREWRDMLSLVKQEAIEDPADEDPELMARLLQNKRQATVKEEELLNRYSQMHHIGIETEEEGDDEVDFQNSNPDVRIPNQREIPNNPKKRVRITPIQLPNNNVSHKIAKIVTINSDIVMTDDKNRTTDNDNNIINSEPSIFIPPDSTEITPVISSIYSLASKHVSDSYNISVAQEINLINPLKQGPISESQKEPEIPSTLSTCTSLNCGKTVENQSLGQTEQYSAKEPGENTVSASKFSECSSVLIQLLTGLSETPLQLKPSTPRRDSTNNTETFNHLKHYVNETSQQLVTNNISDNSGTERIHHRESERGLLNNYEEPSNNNADEMGNTDVVNFKDKVPTPQDQIDKHNFEVSSKSAVDKMNNNDLVNCKDGASPSQPEVVDEQSIVKIKNEILESSEEKDQNSKDNSCIANKRALDDLSANNTDESCSILEHFLRAKVVLPRLTLEYKSTENAAKNTHSNVQSEPTCNENKSVKEEKRIVPEETGIKIKEEPWIDIQKELDEFGDNFTITILDIEDPFLVVEISSDSSSEDEMDTDKCEL